MVLGENGYARKCGTREFGQQTGVDLCLSQFSSPTDCNNYRTIALISHATKVLLNVINERLKVFLLPQISEEQSGFVPKEYPRVDPECPPNH